MNNISRKREKLILWNPVFLNNNGLRIHKTLKGGTIMASCDTCKFRARYDNNPKSLLGRLWKWHIGWCPGWKSYLKSMSDEDREKIKQQYAG
jgi:hypothetical protein